MATPEAQHVLCCSGNKCLRWTGALLTMASKLNWEGLLVRKHDGFDLRQGTKYSSKALGCMQAYICI